MNNPNSSSTFSRRLHVGTHHHHAVGRPERRPARVEHPARARRCRSAGTAASPKRSKPVCRAATAPGRTRSSTSAPHVVRGRPARRQPGADRPDEPGPQAPHVRPAGPDGLQGDRGRLPVGQPDRLRLRPRDHHRGRDPRRRHHPGADAVPARADRADVRGVRRRAARDRALLQLDVDPAAPRGVPRRPRCGQEDRHRRRAQVRRGGREVSRHAVALRVLPGVLHRHRAGVRQGGVRRRRRRHRADAGLAADRQPARHRRDGHARTSTPTRSSG